MERIYQSVLKQYFSENRQMLFATGPRQSGKTTLAMTWSHSSPAGHYFSYDILRDRRLIFSGAETLAEQAGLLKLHTGPIRVALDEFHKYKHWRDFLKNFYDAYQERCHIVVTGSARLDTFSRGGDSLMGRYFLFHFHPFSLAECCQSPERPLDLLFWPEPSNPSEYFDALWRWGPYPEPLFKQSDRFHRRWKTLRRQQLLDEEIRDLSRVRDLDRIEILLELLAHQVGSLTSYQSLSKHLHVSDPTIRQWLHLLNNLYYSFEVRPFSKNISRSLLKEPKYYLWDWSLCPTEGQRAENMLALHLLKSIHLWNDLGLGDYALYFLRDKEKREVDFLVTANGQPWMILEAKLSDTTPSAALRYFQNATQAPYAFQVVWNEAFVPENCFKTPGLWVVPARTFLSQCV